MESCVNAFLNWRLGQNSHLLPKWKPRRCSRVTQTVVVLLGVSGTIIGVGGRNWGEQYCKCAVKERQQKKERSGSLPGRKKKSAEFTVSSHNAGTQARVRMVDCMHSDGDCVRAAQTRARTSNGTSKMSEETAGCVRLSRMCYKRIVGCHESGTNMAGRREAT